MLDFGSPTIVRTSTASSALLRELQQIWDDIGESEAEKDRMLMELEKEIFEVYRRKVDEAANAKARLQQTIAAKQAELATLVAALGELNLLSQSPPYKRSASLKEQLASVTPFVEDLKLKKNDRIKQFADIKAQIQKISGEISECSSLNKDMMNCIILEEDDLSLRRLTEYQTHLRSLQKDKSERLNKVLNYVNEVHTLCGVLGMDFGKILRDVDPSLHGSDPGLSTDISSRTLGGLELAIIKLKAERKDRLQKLKDTVASLCELCNLMDIPEDDWSCFSRIASILGCSDAEIIEPGVLSMDLIDQASAEVERLTKLKAGKMKELVMKKRSELEKICRLAHIEPDTSTAAEKSNALIDSGLVDPSELLGNIEAQIVKAKEEALSRKEIIDRIDRWLSVCEEENWLEEYNRDENRYNAGRGSHINLKRAERARMTVNKIPVIVDNLINKTVTWEEERKMPFLYDGVRLVSILDDYKLTRSQREEEKKRCRDYKKLQDLLLTEKEAMYGSKPSPRKSNSYRKLNGFHANGNGPMTPARRRNSVGCPSSELCTPRSNSGLRNGYFMEMRRLSTVPLNCVALSKDDSMSYASVCSAELGSPPHG
ncbi:hypothetical protein Nepgr_028121 [Nepenthes gracilis]|uniref:65-kDa microtubule-associated protein 6 n=1 Tax=Nepenthes gracilis TaxID=150966 RepID=A0AAD3Y242_NEPGR|nr:hypothetical protein Nepgr_028121 [Nepenthes gracilis]